jgi:cation transport protein ChaC
MPRPLSLTPVHIARVHRTVPDGGVPPGLELQTDADYAAWVDRTLRSHPAPGEPTRLFAYGSLIWKPDFDHTAEQPGTALGWHRAFCFHMKRFRGTPDAPGLMMALDRGGQCRGMLYDLLPGNLDAQLDRLFRREFTSKPNSNVPRWITVRTADGPRPALAFVINRDAPIYAGRLPPDAVARTLATACGHWGTGAEYLMNTVAALEERGIHDRGLWRLQRLVAARIDAMGDA